MLTDLKLKDVYDSSEGSLYDDLIVPLLSHSTSYLRGVGYFTSGWITLASNGILNLINNNGKANIIVSPKLDPDDWDALIRGHDARNDDCLKRILSVSIDEFIVNIKTDVLTCLSWLVADEILDFKIAVPRRNYECGDYHDKVGVFIDAHNNMVAIHGSFNDTYQGSLNGEAFSVFKSWVDGQKPYVDKHYNRLNELWLGNNRQFLTYDIPKAIRNKIVQLKKETKRPYQLPMGLKLNMEPHCPYELFPYQHEAINNWVSNNCCGLFEMATGTGKTITSLAAATVKRKGDGKLALVIIVPYLHLVEQWKRDCIKFGYIPLCCSSSHSGWEISLKSKVQDFNIGSIFDLCVIAVHKTASGDNFINTLKLLHDKHFMIIADEVHGLGSHYLQKALVDNASCRLGLSATPQRWYDDKGTAVIMKYFGGTCFELPLKEAIGKWLVHYKYIPVLITLNEQEKSRYEEISSRITILQKMEKDGDGISEKVKRLLIERSRLIQSADNKYQALDELLVSLSEKAGGMNNIHHLLLYCAPGTHRTVLQKASAKRLRCHEFVHDVTLSEREEVLSQFAAGQIQALVAIKCLDQGVDVPSTETAIFLSSTTNPMEFIQRRGRILRKADGKIMSYVYDFVVIPDVDDVADKSELGKSILRREMPRFAEFASAASNEFEARSVIRGILDKYELLNMLDEKPWDIYKRLTLTEREEYSIEEEECLK